MLLTLQHPQPFYRSCGLDLILGGGCSLFLIQSVYIFVVSAIQTHLYKSSKKKTSSKSLQCVFSMSINLKYLNVKQSLSLKTVD